MNNWETSREIRQRAGRRVSTCRAPKTDGGATARKGRKMWTANEAFSVLSYGCRCARSTGALSWRLTRCGPTTRANGTSVALSTLYSWLRPRQRQAKPLFGFAPHSCHPVEQPGCLSIPILALSPTYLLRLPHSFDLACSGWLSNAAAITTASAASTPTNCRSAFPFWSSLPLTCSCCIHCINVPGVCYVRTRMI